MLKGIFPPIPTPFIDDEITFDKLKFNLERWNKFDLSGYVVMGSNGESAFLTSEEKVKLVEAVRNNTPDNKLIIAGTGSDSIKETINLTKKVTDAGAHYALVLTPSFFKNEMSHSAMISYFAAVADEIPVPLIIYNVPKFTNINIHPDTVAQLSEHKNIVGIKNSSENIADISLFVSQTDDDFSVLAGTASVLYPSLFVGANGGVLALANVQPQECINIFGLFTSGKHNEALELQNKLILPNKAVTSMFGVAGLKAAMDLKGYYGGEPRKPLQKLNSEQINQIEKIFSQSEL